MRNLVQILRLRSAGDLQRLRPPSPGLLATVACLFYGWQLPSTVQGLDTGELALSAWGLFVPHPPGYPLFVWLGALVIRVLPWGSVFWRVSALSAGLAALILIALYQSTPRRWLVLALIIVPLALHPIFWRYALLPDVFMLHAALSCAFMMVTQYAPTKPWHVYRLAMLFALGMSNHQTFIFLMPTALWYAWSFHHANRISTFFYAISLSAIVCFSVYASLLFLHVDALASWGRLHTFSDLLAHMLRIDYGTFRLSPRDTPPGGVRHSLQCIRHMLRVGPFMIGMIIYAAVVIWGQRRRYSVQRIYALGASLLGYIVIFLPRANTTHSGVIERFYLFPLVWAACLAATSLNAIASCKTRPRVKRRYLTAACTVSIGIAALQWSSHHTALNLRDETIVEDYAVNLLGSVPQDRPSILVVHGDSRLHAVRYAQHVLGVRPDVVLLSRTALVPQSTGKLRGAAPALRLPPFAPQQDEAQYVRTLFDLNNAAFGLVVSDTRGMSIDDLHLTFSGLGRQLTLGRGTDVDWSRVLQMQRRADTTRLGSSRQFQEEFDLYAAYAYPFLVAALNTSDVAQARKYLQSALLLVPYCLPAHYELCRREASDNEAVCQAHVQRLRALMGDYF